MSRAPRLRTPREVSESAHQQLNMYALAAGAAGVSVLALAQPADAKIVYTPAHVKISGHYDIYFLDLNRHKRRDFIIQNTTHANSNGWGEDSLFAIGGRSNAAECSVQGYALALAKGSRIGSSGAFCKKVTLELSFGSTSLSYGGNWKNVSDHYLGLKFFVKGKAHYGWARMNVSVGSIEATLTGYAYETIPNKPIITGKIKGSDVIDPEPGSLGALAVGRK